MDTQKQSESSPLLQSEHPPSPRPSTAIPSTPSAPAVSPSALARPNSQGRSKPLRTVTFDPNPITRTIEASPVSSPPSYQTAPSYRHRNVASATPASNSSGVGSYGSMSVVASARSAIAGGAGGITNGGGGGPPVLAAINNRLRRRNSYSVPSSASLQYPMQQQAAPPKIGPQRSTKNAQKLKLLPNPDFGDEGPDEESGRDVYSQYTRIKDPTARRDAAILGKADRTRLPRVTAYCTANRYQMEGLMRFFKGRGKARGGNPKLIDECIYTPYNYDFGKISTEASASANKGSEPQQQQRQQRQRQQQQPQQQPDQGQDRKSQPLPYYRERRHSTGEMDAEPDMQQRRDGLIDLEVGPDQEHGDSRLREDAVIEDDVERGRNPYRPGSNSVDGFYDVEQQASEEQQRRREHEEQGLLVDIDDREHHERGREHEHEHDHDHDHDHDHEQDDEQRHGERPVDLDVHVHTPELFLFDYGVVVIWGMSEAQEQRFLKELAKFETEKLGPDDVEAEFFNFYYTREYQARIYNDFIALRDPRNYMTKLAISHALAQSVKTSLFEELIASTIDTCKDIPTQIALTGTIALSRTQINMQIGELFILRISIHLNGSVLDTPELFWVEPHLEPVYQAVRSYLEMDQRVGLLTQRLDVIADLLAVLKEQLSHGHDEKLEWIVIILIAAEILVAAINIVVDVYAGE